MTSPATVLNALPAISLGELESSAALMNRVDRKYFVPRALLGELLPDAGAGLHALEIGGLRTFRYRSVYLDTSRFDLYRQHAQGRRNRFKVRTRTYRDSGGCHLEVKSKGLRGLTVKQRIPHDPDRPGELGDEGKRFVAAVTRLDAGTLAPVVHTDYLRSTLVQHDHRITIDERLEFRTAERCVAGPDDLLVETKSAGGASDLDRMLVRRGIRPHRVSKYCLAASLLHPELPGNDWSRIRRRYWPEVGTVRGFAEWGEDTRIPYTMPPAISAAPTTSAQPTGAIVSRTVVTSAPTGTRPANSPARSGPRLPSAVYQSRKAIAVTTTPR